MPAQPAAKNGLGIASLVLGIIAFLTAFIPFLSLFVSVPLGLTGVLLAILGFVRISKRKADNAVVTVFGIVLSALAIIIGISSTVITSAFLSAAVEEDSTDTVVEASTGEDPVPGQEPDGDQPAAGGAEEQEQADTAASTDDQFPGQEDDDVVAKAGDKVTIDGVEITVSELKKVSDSITEYLCTDVSIANNGTENYSYSEYDWKVQTPGGVVDDSTIAFTDDTLGVGELVPGGKVSGKVCFELNKETKAKGKYIILHDELLAFSSDRIAWIDER